jgi:hypothetical protein
VKLALGVAALVVLAYLAVAAAAFFLQPQLIFFPGIGRDDPTTPASYGLAFEDIRILTEDGERLHAWYVPAAQARGTALLFHGNAGSIAQRVAWLPMFQKLRLNALLVEYRGYGRSSGSPSERGFYLDAGAALTHLSAERATPTARVVVFGESLGGAVAARLASEQPVGAVVLMSTFTSAPDLAAELYPFLPARLLTRYEFDSLASMPRIAVPVIVAHSRDDEIVPFAHGRRLYEAASEPKAFLDLSGGHNDGFIFARPDWVARLDGFLSTHWAGGR